MSTGFLLGLTISSLSVCTPSPSLFCQDVIIFIINSSVTCFLEIPHFPPSSISDNFAYPPNYHHDLTPYLPNMSIPCLTHKHSEFFCPVCSCPTSPPAELPPALQGSLQKVLPSGLLPLFLWWNWLPTPQDSTACMYLSVAFITLCCDFAFSCF